MSKYLLGIGFSIFVILAIVYAITPDSGDAPAQNEVVKEKSAESADAPVATKITKEEPVGKPVASSISEAVEEKPVASTDTSVTKEITSLGSLNVKEMMADKAIGSADAPVTMIEYSSLTCPHCANFHTDILPSIKKDFVDTGKVRVVFKDFPFGNLAMAATMIARCSGRNYVPMIEALFQSQATWSHSDTPFDAISGIARLSGMSIDDVENCLDNEPLLRALQVVAKDASENLGVESTPTFFIEGVKVPGNLPYGDFKDLLNKALAKKQ